MSERRRKRVVMARLTRLDRADRRFDLEFWERVGAEGRFAALWEMVCEANAFKGDAAADADQPRLQRSVCRVERR